MADRSRLGWVGAVTMAKGRAGGHRHGFTLLEVMVALVIAAFSLGLMYDAVSSSLTGVHIAGRYAEALSRARSHLAAIGQDPAAVIGHHDGDDGGGFTWRLVVEPIPGERSLGGMTVYGCAVTISWQDGIVPRGVTLETRRIGVAQGKG